MEWKRPRMVKPQRSKGNPTVVVAVQSYKSNGYDVDRIKFAFNYNAAAKMAAKGERFIIGIDGDRIFFKADKAGFTLTGQKTKYLQMSVDESELEGLIKFTGEHDLLYSKASAMYYIDNF